MWEISECDAKFLHNMNLVPQNDLATTCPSWQYPLKILITIFIDKHVFAYNSLYHSINALEHACSFLECMVNEQVFMNIVSRG